MFLSIIIMTSTLGHHAMATYGCTADVTVTCGSCTTNSEESEFRGTVGSNMTFELEIDNLDFTVVSVTYDGKKNMILVAPTNTINDDGVTDTRLKDIRLSNLKNSIKVKLTITSLSVSDDGKVLEYIYRPATLDEFVCKKTIRISVPSSSIPTTMEKIVARIQTTEASWMTAKVRSTSKLTQENRIPTTEKRTTTTEAKQPMTEQRQPSTKQKQPTTMQWQPTMKQIQLTTETKQMTPETRQTTTTTRTTTGTRTTTAEKRIIELEQPVMSERRSTTTDSPSPIADEEKTTPSKKRTTPERLLAKFTSPKPTSKSKKPVNEDEKSITTKQKPTTNLRKLMINQDPVINPTSSRTTYAADRIPTEEGAPINTVGLEEPFVDEVTKTPVTQTANEFSAEPGESKTSSKSVNTQEQKMQSIVEGTFMPTFTLKSGSEPKSAFAPTVASDKSVQSSSVAENSSYNFFIVLSTTLTFILLL